jgi:hypothetical protein
MSGGEPVPPAADFLDQQKLLEEALADAKEEYAALGEEDDPGHPRQKILYYQTALDFKLPIWSGDFYFESASVYADLYREWEILNAYPSPETAQRKLYLEEKLILLGNILQEKNVSNYLSFYQTLLREEEELSEEEIQNKISELSLRFYATLDGNLSSGESDAIYKMGLIRESLGNNTQNFHPALKGKSLSPKDRNQLEQLFSFYQTALENGTTDPLPGNSATLGFCVKVGAFFLYFVFSLLSVRRKKIQNKFLFLLFFPSVILFWMGMIFATLLYAPGSLVPVPLFLFGKIFTLPSPLYLFFSLVLSLLSYLPFFLLAQILRKRTERSHFYTLIPPLSALFYDMVSLLLRLILGKSPFLYFLPFFYTDLKSALLPEYPFYLPQSPSSFLSIFIFALLSTGLYLLCKKAIPKSF